MPQSIKGEIVQEYLRTYPNEFKRTLARKILEQRPDVFSDLEAVRCLVRYYCQAHGVRVKGREDKRETRDRSEYMQEYYLRHEPIPETEPYTLPKGASKIGILSDIHFPYHDERAIDSAINYFLKQGINTLLLNGDTVDFYQISRWSRDPRRASMSYEIEMCIEFWELLNDAFPDQIKYWKPGNHEERWEQVFRLKAKELIGIPDFELSSILEIEKHGLKAIGSRQRINAGKLTIFHGHEMNVRWNPVNPARGMFTRIKGNGLCGHFHQTSEHSESDVHEKPLACFSTGCLSTLRPEYMPLAYLKWNHGAAIAYIESDGLFTVDNFRIVDGKIR